MKKLLLFLFVIGTFSSKLNAQYLPLVEEDKYWIYNSYFNTDMPSIGSSHLIHFEGDTLIENRFYKKVIKQTLAGSHPCPPQERPCFVADRPYTTISKGISGFVREEVDSQKVYFLPIFDHFCDTQEFLLFDFSKVENDTLNECLRAAIGKNEFNEFGIIDSITTIELHNKQRKVLNSTGLVTYIGLPYEGKIIIAEGFGLENYGPFHRYGNSEELADFCEGNCEILSSSKELEASLTTKIHPNPTTSNLTIESNFSISNVEVISLLGVKESINISNNQLITNHLTNGIYFLKISHQNESVSILKFIKN